MTMRRIVLRAPALRGRRIRWCDLCFWRVLGVLGLVMLRVTPMWAMRVWVTTCGWPLLPAGGRMGGWGGMAGTVLMSQAVVVATRTLIAVASTMATQKRMALVMALSALLWAVRPTMNRPATSV